MEVTVSYLRSIQDYVSSRLPSHMMPTIWLAVEQMPRTTSTKIDRISMNEWLKTRNLSSAKATLNRALTATLTPPCTAEEKLLRSIWSSVRAILEQDIGRESHFRQLGGDSILAMQADCMKRGLRLSTASLSKNLPLAVVADSATKIEHMYCEAIVSKKAADRVVKRTAALWDVVKICAQNFIRLNVHFRRDNIEAIVPATDGQEVMIAAGESGGRGYYMEFVREFKPGLDVARLRKVCERIINVAQYCVLYLYDEALLSIRSFSKACLRRLWSRKL